MIRWSTPALAGLLMLALPATAAIAADSADELQSAIAKIREKVDAQRAETGSAAKDAAERAAEMDRLVTHMAALEHQNDELRDANARLTQDLDDALRRAARLERENDAMARVASAKLDSLSAATQQLGAARSELERITALLADLEAGRAVLTAVEQDLPLLVAGPSPARAAFEDAEALRAELAKARAQITILEARKP